MWFITCVRNITGENIIILCAIELRKCQILWGVVIWIPPVAVFFWISIYYHTMQNTFVTFKKWFISLNFYCFRWIYTKGNQITFINTCIKINTLSCITYKVMHTKWENFKQMLLALQVFTLKENIRHKFSNPNIGKDTSI